FAPPLLASTSSIGHCPKCLARWERIILRPEKPGPAQSNTAYPKGSNAHKLALARQAARASGHESVGSTISGGFRPSCECDELPVPDVVMDLFFGSGTVGEVAGALGRDFIGFELNPAYEEMQKVRTAQPGLAV